MAIFYGEKRAMNEIASVLESQWANGMLPHIRFVPGQEGYSPDAEEWGVTPEISGNARVATSGITQPPNIAFALWKVFGASQNKPGLVPFLQEFYPKLKRFHAFLLSERDPNGEGLACVFHPWATGSDNTPCYDEAVKRAREELAEKGFEQRIKKRKDAAYVAKGQRPKHKDYEAYGRLLGFFVARNYGQGALYRECPFVVQDVLFNSLFQCGLDSMARIAEALAMHFEGSGEEGFWKKEAEMNRGLALKVANAIRKKLFDEETGYFYSFDLRANELIKVPTVHSFAPMLGSIATGGQAEALMKHLFDEKEFSPKQGYMVPSVPLNENGFDPVGYARGPVWPVRNWIVARGLENYDKKAAEKLRLQTIELIAQGHKDIGMLAGLAASLMEFNSFGEAFTVPSKRQYCHGWLWDSGFAALAWRRVKEKPKTGEWEKVERMKKELVEKGAFPREAKEKARQEFEMPLFDEYYAPVVSKEVRAGMPLGSDMMTWTAALFLDLLEEK
jgi:hypothetical protein